MRVQSATPMHNGGWWHPASDPKPAVYSKPEPPRPHINATALMRQWQSETDPGWIRGFAKELGVSSEALSELGCAWASPHRAFAFPMKDGYGNTIGIRLRDQNGRKWAVTGSRAGLFYGKVFKDCTLYIAEGPTDTAAGITIGLNIIGRPSCAGQEDFIITKSRAAKRMIIISDNDSPGWSGAERLQQMVKKTSLIWAPPAKDLREFVTRGGNKSMIEQLTSSLCWTTT